MQIRQTLALFSSVFVLLVALWALFFTTELFQVEKSNANWQYLPLNASKVVRIDGNKLINKTLFSVLLEANDQEMMNLIKKIIAERKEKKPEFINDGIDVHSDVILFEEIIQEKAVQGMLVNLFNTKKFDAYFNQKEIIHANNGLVGVILFKNESIDPKVLQKSANEIVNTQRDTKPKISDADELLNGTLNFNTTKYQEYSVNRLDFTIKMLKDGIFLNGSGRVTKKINLNAPMLAPKGLHVSSAAVPSWLNDTLNNKLTEFEIKLPDIKNVSLNLMGTKVINHSTGFIAIPQMELYIRTASNFSVRAFFQNTLLKEKLDYELGTNYISFQNEKVYFKQLSPTSFYIGKSEKPVLIKNQSKTIFNLKGDLSVLTHVEGGGMMTAILEMIPVYSATKHLSNNITTLNVELTLEKEDKAKFLGELSFKEGISPLNEIMKFLLVSQITN